ncbi:TetR/AcrR family transcriptional regulator [Kitasatospora sp. NPDC089509]|uniref:TetR/AcrR family transcriptional regulator n=1 Tax=Kitasatospora sp. NPDC089509 TaxID=3364079 RepID=UPI0038290259
MSHGSGSRERKKQQTQRVISEAAIALSLERGFDQVSVVDVAALADVSEMTVFNYFPTKEDLVLHRFENDVDDIVTIVLGRGPGEFAAAGGRAGSPGCDHAGMAHDILFFLAADDEAAAGTRLRGPGARTGTR